MKKVSGLYIFWYVFAVLLLSALAGILLGGYTGNPEAFIGFFIMTLFLLGITVFVWFFTSSNAISDSIMKKTVKKYEGSYGFVACRTFTAYNAILKVDVPTGRIAFISWLNPFEFQVISAAEIENVTSSYMEGPFGGTNYVYFQFFHKGKKFRIPTFVAIKAMYRLDSVQVLEGVSKADAYAELLNQAKENAIRLGVR